MTLLLVLLQQLRCLFRRLRPLPFGDDLLLAVGETAVFGNRCYVERF